uniref:Mucin-5AC-like n=1 Tax=Cicer arietinum TaxID=3827 RepID=A0A1S2XNI8_CICAR|nr:mucin-5AC-like [Cicer arietinum]
MARTKQYARKNASPSPPPRPSPPHTSSASPSPHNSQEVLNLIPLSTFLPPLYTRPTPNFAQVPLHLRTRITPPRRSMCVQSGIGTSKSMNPKPFYFIISDSESDDSSDSCPPVAKSPTQTEPQRNTMPTVPTPPPQIPSTTTNPSTPSKSAFSSEPSHSTPPHQKQRSLNDIISPSTNQKEPLSQPKPPTKHMKTKNTITIAQFLARKNLPNPQRKKTLAPKQNLKTKSSPHPQSCPQKHTKRSSSPQPSSISTSSDSEPSPPTKKPKQNAPLVITLAKSNLFNEKWAQRPVEIGRVFVFDNLVVDGNVVQHHTDVLGWTSFLKISESYFQDVEEINRKTTSKNPISFSSPSTDPKEISDKTPTPERSPPPPEHIPSHSTLFAQTSGTVSSHIPSYSQTLHCTTHDFSTFLSNPLLSTMSPLFVSPQKTSSSIFGISQFLNFPATAGPSTSSVGPLPSVSSSFASIPSLSAMPIPSNTVVATSSQPSAHLPSTSTLVAPSNSNIMAALQIIMARQIQHDQETALLRTWMADHLAPKLGIPPPPPHPVPPPSQIPHPGKSSSSEGSSPSLAS